jgi:hypothetical protein
MKKREKKPVIVRIKDQNPELGKNAALYLFGEDGKLMEWVLLSKAESKLKSAPESIEGIAIMMIGPSLPEDYDMSRLNTEILTKMGGTMFQTRLTPEKEILITEIPVMKLPLFNKCLVTGHLTKNFIIDGVSKELPICNARIHICEVDRKFLLWPKIPPIIVDDLSARLKEILKKLKVRKPVGPFPPGPGPGPKFRTPLFNVMKAVANAGITVNSLERDFKLPELPDKIITGLNSPTPEIARETMVKNFQLLHPYLCLWPHLWPWFYTCDEIATVYSDKNGQFDYKYFNLLQTDDIYVWVEVFIDGHWETVYRPPMPCHTWWDYKCGTDIHITITDPRVTPNCQIPLPGELVWFRSIGEYATALHIEQNMLHKVNVQGADYDNVGCTDVLTDVLGNHHPISPFGGSLYFKLMFGDGFPSSAVTHYRWRKTMIRDAALNPLPLAVSHVVAGSVYKYYYIITTDIFGHQHFETKGVLLGAEGTGENIGYRIPKWDIKQDPGVPAPDKLLTIQWTSPDFWSAALDSNSLEDGLWRFDLELLAKDPTGNFVAVSVPKQVFQVTQANNYGNSVNAPDTYLGLIPLLPALASRLSVKVRIDNAHCEADIQDATITVGGVTKLSGPCGFLQYTDPAQPVKISFNASHPRNFALFHFWVVKGNNTNPITPSIDQNGYVNSSVGGYNLASGVFSRDVSVDQLKGSCPQAAFAENLYVRALATNGTRYLYEYDDSDTNAFAVSNT